MKQPALVAAGILVLSLRAWSQAPAQWKAHDITRPRPPIVKPADQKLPIQPPADAVVLFDGRDLSQWRSEDGSPAKWVAANGYMESVKGSGYVFSRRTFGDVQLHVEWAAPVPAMGKSQGRGNSGVFLMGQYEIQVLDSYENETYADGQAASVYGQYPPLVNVCRPPGEWQSYDIVFRRPRFDRNGGAAQAGASHTPAQRRFGSRQCRVVGTHKLAAAFPLPCASRQAAHFTSGPRKSRALSKHLAARASRME